MILALHYAGHGEPYYGKAIVTELVEPALRPLKLSRLPVDFRYYGVCLRQARNSFTGGFETY